MKPLLELVAVIVPLVLAIVCHEVAHGWVARALGDHTAQDAKRLSLNPFRHIDPIGTVVLPGMLALAKLPVFGWAKPVPVDASRLRNPRFGMMLVAIAGPLTNLVLGAAGAVLLGLLARAGALAGPGAQLLGATIESFMMINIFLALFNLLPVPPFDGSHIVEGLLPRRAAQVYARLRPAGMPLMLVLLVVLPWLAPQAGIVSNLVLPPVIWTSQRYYELAAAIAAL